MRKKPDVGNERCCIRKKKITDSEESLSLILLGVGKCDLEPNAISRKYFNAWKLVASEMRFPVSFLIYPLAFAQILSSYPQGPRVGYWCLSLSFCSTFVVERFYRHIKSKGRGTPGAGRALPEDFRTLCVYVCVCVCVCARAHCHSLQKWGWGIWVEEVGGGSSFSLQGQLFSYGGILASLFFLLFDHFLNLVISWFDQCWTNTWLGTKEFIPIMFF